MRLLLATFCLLVIITSASAECAWVLWNVYVDGTKPMERSIEAAFETKADCEVAIPKSVASHLVTWTELYGKGGGKVAHRSPVIIVDKAGTGAKEDQMLIGLSCWPIGLQPRSLLGGAEYPRDLR